jgi:hypothetical protein
MESPRVTRINIEYLYTLKQIFIIIDKILVINWNLIPALTHDILYFIQN